MPRCNHVKTNGHYCGSPALRNSEFCYYHDDQVRRERRRVTVGGPVWQGGRTGIELPVIEDEASILVASTEIMHALLDLRIDQKRASLLLYSLQVCASVIKRASPSPQASTICRDRDPEPEIAQPALPPKMPPQSAMATIEQQVLGTGTGVPIDACVPGPDTDLSPTDIRDLLRLVVQKRDSAATNKLLRFAGLPPEKS